MESLEHLLSDEYVQFSQVVAEIHALKKACKEDFKKKHEEYQANLKSLDAKAVEAAQKFEEWKAAKTANVQTVKTAVEQHPGAVTLHDKKKG
jgi:septation ring formation regulator EzrA